jgi:cobalt-zinc-cadmium resistance protein CzcA
LIIGLFTLALIIWGSYSLKKLPIDAVPDITDNQVMVITVTPTLAAQEVERLVTFPVEQTMARIPNIHEIHSNRIIRNPSVRSFYHLLMYQ